MSAPVLAEALNGGDLPWFKVDDGFSSSEPVMRIPRRNRERLAAIGLWTLAGAWAAKELTDGFIPAHLLAEFGATAKTAAALVAAGLWVEVDNGWKFHHWHSYQPSRASVLSSRSRESERKRRWREGRRGVSSEDAATSGECPGGTTPSVPGVSHPASDYPDPTRPYKDKTPPVGPPRKSAKTRSARLSPEYMPSTAEVRRMRDECPGVDFEAEHRKFVDYWIAQPGERGRKVDWAATWRNWMRRAAERATPAQGLSRREMNIVQAERFKTSPDPDLLRGLGFDPKALPGGEE